MVKGSNMVNIWAIVLLCAHVFLVWPSLGTPIGAMRNQLEILGSNESFSHETVVNDTLVFFPDEPPLTYFNKSNVLNRIPGNCKPSPLQFDCGNGLCLNISKFRDCHADCPDGVDEACWEGQTRCDGCKCIDPGEEATKCRRH